jgi:hypothetical protein
MDTVQNCNSYINIPSSQTYRSNLMKTKLLGMYFLLVPKVYFTIFKLYIYMNLTFQMLPFRICR